MEINIPGRDILQIKYLLCDYNGTLAKDGVLLPGIFERFQRLSEHLEIVIVTADTHGNVRKMVEDLPCKVHVIGPRLQDEEKLRLLLELGPARTVAVGNGFNDRLIIEKAVLGFAVIQQEGAMPGILLKADVVCTDICDVLDLLIIPSRLVATLRN